MFFGLHDPSSISKRALVRAERKLPGSVSRLARYLKLHTDGMSVRQVIKLVYWRLSRRRMYG